MLNVNKKVVGSLEKCYAMTTLNYQGKDHFLVAAEKVNECRLYDFEGNLEDVVWKEPGGVMTMQQVPGTDGQFLATHKFYSPNDSKEASIVIVTPKGKGDWEVRKLVDLPFVHRFGILQNKAGKNYLIACCLKSDHEYKEDWRFPGRVFAAELPEDLSSYNADNQLEMTVIKDNMLKNHGYFPHKEADGSVSCVVSCDNGVFQFFPPDTGNEWTIKELVTDAASDGLLLDINGDGVEELCTIAPFHGNTVNIYNNQDGKFVLAYTYEKKLDFLHAIFGGMIAGKPTWILGHRKAERYLVAFTYEDGQYQAQILDEGCGAANVMHYVYEGKDLIVATNREVDEIAIYELT